MSEQVEVLAEIKRPAGLPARVIGTLGEAGDRVLVVAEIGANGHFHQVGRKVDYARARHLAEAVLAGDPQALTWPDALMVLAVTVVGVFLEIDSQLKENSDAEGSAASPTAEPPAEAASPPSAGNAYRDASRGG